MKLPDVFFLNPKSLGGRCLPLFLPALGIILKKNAALPQAFAPAPVPAWPAPVFGALLDLGVAWYEGFFHPEAETQYAQINSLYDSNSPKLPNVPQSFTTSP